MSKPTNREIDESEILYNGRAFAIYNSTVFERDKECEASVDRIVLPDNQKILKIAASDYKGKGIMFVLCDNGMLYNYLVDDKRYFDVLSSKKMISTDFVKFTCVEKSLYDFVYSNKS